VYFSPTFAQFVNLILAMIFKNILQFIYFIQKNAKLFLESFPFFAKVCETL